MPAGQAEGGAGGEDAFGYFAAQAFENFLEVAATAEGFAHGAVAAERAGAGEDQVAQAGEAGKGFAACAAGYGETGDLGDAAGDEGGGGVVAEAGAGGDSGGDGDDVFEGAAELDADEVGAGVEAEGCGRELVLDAGGDGGIGEGDGEGGGLGLGDFKGEAGPLKAPMGRGEKLASGAKAPASFCGGFGTTEVVP